MQPYYSPLHGDPSSYLKNKQMKYFQPIPSKKKNSKKDFISPFASVSVTLAPIQLVTVKPSKPDLFGPFFIFFIFMQMFSLRRFKYI